MTEHGARMLMIYGSSVVGDSRYNFTAAWIFHILLSRRQTVIGRPSLAPWQLSYAAAPGDPARYNLPPDHQRRALDSDTIEDYPVGPCGLSVAPIHERGITRWRVRVKLQTHAPARYNPLAGTG